MSLILLGHRGLGPIQRPFNRYQDHCFENTMPAFLQAIAQGASGIELDLRVTCDQQVIICHDDHIKFSDSTCGITIKDSTLKELRDYCENSGLVIPTFSEVIQGLISVRGMFANSDSLIINAELKDSNVACHIPEILQMNTKNGEIGIENLLFNSSDWNAIRELKAFVPEARVCLNVDGSIFAVDREFVSLSAVVNTCANLESQKQALESFLDSVDCYGIDIKVGYINNAAIEFCQSRNLALVACVSDGNEERELHRKYCHIQRALPVLSTVFIKSNNIQFSSALFAGMSIDRNYSASSLSVSGLAADF